MFKFLEKYGFVKMLSLDDSYFYNDNNLPNKVKISNDLIKFNYLKYSPFKNSNFISSKNKNSQLMIWFYAENYAEKIIIPEYFLLEHTFKRFKEDTIFIFEINDIIKYFIKKDSRIIAMSIFSVQNIELNLRLLQEEFSIKNIESFDSSEYSDFINIGKSKLNIFDLYKWNNYEYNTKEDILKFVTNSAYPISIILTLSIVLNYYHSHKVENEINQLKKDYIKIKESTKNIKKDIQNKVNMSNEIYLFANNEVNTYNINRILSEIYKVFIDEKNTTILNLSFSNLELKLRIKSDAQAIAVINKLNKINIFDSIILENIKKNEDENIISFKIKVKEIK